MSLRTINIVVAAFMLVPGVLSGQVVNVGVAAIDLTVKSRVQDPDRPDSALLVGGSTAWTGQPIMRQTQPSGTSGSAQKPGSMSRTSQFPSLVGSSVWGPSSVVASSSLNTSGAQVLTKSVSRWTKAPVSRKLNVMMATAEVRSARPGRAQGELLVEENQLSDSRLQLRKLQQATARSARSRTTNPLRSKADASTASHWGGGKLSASAIAQQQHESGMLLLYGFNARSNRQRHRHRSAAAPSH
jgi:hypothetical protein